MTDSCKDRLPAPSRRQFVLGASAALVATGFSGPFSFAREARPHNQATVLTGNEIDLKIGYQEVNFTGAKRLATTVNNGLPGPTLRLKEGQPVTLNVTNTLDQDSSIHWHGILLPTEMDGVPGMSFGGIRPGETFRYHFDVAQSGTYWYHSHSGFQEQTGVYGALVVEPQGPDPVAYDRDHVVLLSDWTDEDPHNIYAKLKKMSHYYNYNERTLVDWWDDVKAKGFLATWRDRKMWNQMRMSETDIADVTGSTYTYLMNGNTPETGWVGLFEKGEKVRLRFINASAMTIFDVRIPGLKMTVVATDGQNVQPVPIDEFRIGIAETYDVVVEPEDETAYTVFAQGIDRTGYARGTLAPHMDMRAVVPAMDPSPVLGHRDMGMDHSAMGHGSGHMGHESMDHGSMEHRGMGRSGTDHSQMNHGNVGQSTAGHNTRNPNGMGHGRMDAGDTDHSAMDHSTMGHSDMDHGQMGHEGMDHPPMRHQEAEAHAGHGDHSQHQSHSNEVKASAKPVVEHRDHRGHTPQPLNLPGAAAHVGHGDNAEKNQGIQAITQRHENLGKAGFGSNAPIVHAKTEFGPHVDMRADAPVNGLNDPGLGLREHQQRYGRRVLTYADLRSLAPTADKREPERELQIHLTGNMGRYMWSMNGIKHADAAPIELRYGERLRILLVNDTMMTHPIHLHGMWSELETGDPDYIPRKHTILVQPGAKVSYLVTADARGRWAYHCHLLFHMPGMMREVVVR